MSTFSESQPRHFCPSDDGRYPAPCMVCSRHINGPSPIGVIDYTYIETIKLEFDDGSELFVPKNSRINSEGIIKLPEFIDPRCKDCLELFIFDNAPEFAQIGGNTFPSWMTPFMYPNYYSRDEFEDIVNSDSDNPKNRKCVQVKLNPPVLKRNSG